MRLAAKAPRRRRPVSSTLGHALKPPHKLISSSCAAARHVYLASAPSRTSWRVPATPRFESSKRRVAGRAVAQAKARNRASAPVCARPNHQQASSGWRFAPARCAAQSVRGSRRPRKALDFGRRRSGGADERVPCLSRFQQRVPRQRHRSHHGWACRRQRLLWPRKRGLTCRSTGAPTARQPGREAQLVYHPPRGRAPSPPSPG
jgi:hypothetical protein